MIFKMYNFNMNDEYALPEWPLSEVYPLLKSGSGLILNQVVFEPLNVCFVSKQGAMPSEIHRLQESG